MPQKISSLSKCIFRLQELHTSTVWSDHPLVTAFSAFSRQLLVCLCDMEDKCFFLVRCTTLSRTFHCEAHPMIAVTNRRWSRCDGNLSSSPVPQPRIHQLTVSLILAVRRGSTLPRFPDAGKRYPVTAVKTSASLSSSFEILQ